MPQAEVKEMARKRFASIRAGHLALSVITDSGGYALQGMLVQPCALGACDVFVSHSWQDCGKAKWKALQACRAEDSLWIDRCCANEEKNDVYLWCLPIFLKACRRLMVLCGP